MDRLKATVSATGLSAGLDRVGVAGVEPFEDVRLSLHDRREAGHSASLKFTFKDPATATDVGVSFPWAQGLVVGGKAYLPSAGASVPRSGQGRIARFAVDDAYQPLRAGLEAVRAVLGEAGYRTELLVDDDRLVDRAAAVRAGIGWWGKNSMVLAPQVGPWMLLGSVVTDAPLPPDAPMERDCGTCSACLPACPTGALVAPGILDARRCLAAIAQGPGVIPRRWREAMGDRLYGCDDCLDACPPGRRLGGRATTRRGSVELAWVLAAADRSLLDRFSHFYLPGRSPRILRRNALVAIGNGRLGRHSEVAAAHVGHHDWVLRAHAVWALARIGGPSVRPVLVHQQAREERPEVRAELATELLSV